MCRVLQVSLELMVDLEGGLIGKKTLDNVNKPLDPCELDDYQQYITHSNCKTENIVFGPLVVKSVSSLVAKIRYHQGE